MNATNNKYIVNTLDGEEVKVSRDRLVQLADMSDKYIETLGYIAESVRDEYNRHFRPEQRQRDYSVIVVATQTEQACRYDYAAYHLESEGGTLATQQWKGQAKSDKFWQRAIHFVVNQDMSWGLLSDTIESPLCWRTSSNVFVSCELACDEVANNMLDIARAVAYPEQYITWSAELERRECGAVRAKSKS